MRLLFPNPVKKAFDFVERLEPSITNTFLTGNFTDPAYASMASFSSPGCIGVNLLKRGMIQVGATYCITSEKIVTPIQQ